MHLICYDEIIFSYLQDFRVGLADMHAMLADKLTEYGYEVKKMDVPHIQIKNLKNPSFALFSAIKGIVSKEKFDIVHAFNIPSGYAMKYVKGSKKSVICPWSF